MTQVKKYKSKFKPNTWEWWMEDKLRCPNCGSVEFTIGLDSIWTDKATWYAECTECLTSSLIPLMKIKYHKDVTKHFQRGFIDVVQITEECSECGKTYNHPKPFKMIHYFGTDITKYIPELKHWKCPDHPKAEVGRLHGVIKHKQILRAGGVPVEQKITK